MNFGKAARFLKQELRRFVISFFFSFSLDGQLTRRAFSEGQVVNRSDGSVGLCS